jgi:hypothetical protein
MPIEGQRPLGVGYADTDVINAAYGDHLDFLQAIVTAKPMRSLARSIRIGRPQPAVAASP